VKVAYLDAETGLGGKLTAVQSRWVEHLRSRWGAPREELLQRRALRDLEAGDGAFPARLVGSGRLTLARLLAGIEPYRARWVLQHLPYAAARAIRPLMRGERWSEPAATVLRTWEARVLELAWGTLRAASRGPDRPARGDSTGGE
jgi:hypothetical protein